MTEKKQGSLVLAKPLPAHRSSMIRRKGCLVPVGSRKKAPSIDGASGMLPGTKQRVNRKHRFNGSTPSFRHVLGRDPVDCSAKIFLDPG